MSSSPTHLQDILLPFYGNQLHNIFLLSSLHPEDPVFLLFLFFKFPFYPSCLFERHSAVDLRIREL
jgi:hypothetical protein